MKRKLLSLLLAGVMALSLAACNQSSDNGSPDNGSAQDLDADGVLTQALSQEKDITSLGATMVMDMQLKLSAAGEEQTMDMSMTTDMATISDPLKLKMIMTTEAMGESAVVQVYAQKQDDSFMMYVNDGSSWTSGAVNESDLEGYMATANLSPILAGGVELKETGSEELEGRDTFHYTGSYTGENAKELLLSSGTLDSVSQLGLDATELMDSIGEELSGIPVNIWIDKENCQVLRYDMDMSSIMNDIFAAMLASMGSEAEGMSMECPVAKITVDCRDYNAVTDIEIPEEALAAS